MIAAPERAISTVSALASYVLVLSCWTIGMAIVVGIVWLFSGKRTRRGLCRTLGALALVALILLVSWVVPQ